MIDYKKIIIDTPDARDLKLKFRDRIITFLFWVFWLYLFRPLVAAFLWWIFGLHIFSKESFAPELYDEIKLVITNYSMVITVLGTAFVVWAVYNWITFGKLNRRRFIPHVTTAEIASFFKVDSKKLEKWIDAKHLIMKFGRKAEIKEVEILQD
ncbi:poly-beta-1,6-N-acetyl-D-glucosamine biosynthesis protein PgaD [Nitrosophilus alvini]|uniref:poly-beta-1,6-N-acetyl-D-glucosamine biosynthesis protein PgaD n=1 Tax=Nitrosophilus alvini TaxID=2714855 RepID=UPI0019090D07|nr:poly-beta-1,6-N-acetyl-D-glucosamine biosynthesis protein PgaD [Nitrosophilus alvini]